jgi:hypothetical protein
MLWEEFHRPGAARAFRVVKPDEMQGEHWFELRPADGATLVRHTIEGSATGKYEMIWRERIEPFHDLILEALLDNIQAAVAGRVGRDRREAGQGRDLGLWVPKTCHSRWPGVFCWTGGG